MTEHDTDSSLEQKIEQRYRALSTEQPPASLDRQIMAAAHRAVAETRPVTVSGRNTWLHSLAYAAVLVVAVSVIIEVSMQPDVLQIESSSLIEEERSAPAARAVPEAENSASGISNRRRAEIESLSRKQMQKAKKAETKASQVLPSMASEPAQAPSANEVQMFEMAVPDSELMMQDEARIESPPQKTWRRDPDLWLQHCQQLLMDNNIDELTTELAAFQRQHADYGIPKNLSDWLAQSSLSPKNP